MKAAKRGMWSWFLQRLTGILLITAMAVHFIVTHFHSHTAITFEQVSSRLQTTTWQLFDLSLLALVIYHGFNGLWAIMLDFKPSIPIKNVVGWGLSLFGMAIFVYGSWALMAFTK